MASCSADDVDLRRATTCNERIVGEFPLARHIGIVVESADDAAVVLRAPLAPNANYKGTAFGGSLYSLRRADRLGLGHPLSRGTASCAPTP